jgi:hypothetical protein
MEFALRTAGVPRVLDRRISNAGRLHDIRKRDPQQIFTTGGIPKYSMLGSQNAIGYVPIAYPVSTQTEPELPAKKDSGTGTEPPPEPESGGFGRTQSKESQEAMAKRKEEAEKKPAPEKPAAKKPSEKEPYDLSTAEGKKNLAEMGQYLIDEYGYKESEDIRRAVEVDSKAFTDALRLIRKINLSIKKAPRDDFEKVGQSLLNVFADGVIEVLGMAVGAGAKKAGIPDIAAGTIIESVKDIAKDFKPSNPKDFVQTMREMRAKLLEGKPHWRSKYDEIMKSEWDEKVKKEIADMDAGVPAGAEPPKKRKLRKSVPIKI